MRGLGVYRGERERGLIIIVAIMIDSLLERSREKVPDWLDCFEDSCKQWERGLKHTQHTQNNKKKIKSFKTRIMWDFVVKHVEIKSCETIILLQIHPHARTQYLWPGKTTIFIVGKYPSGRVSVSKKRLSKTAHVNMFNKLGNL